jgi:hypothetical protein
VTRVAVIIPTVAGRENLLPRCIKEHCPPWLESHDVTFSPRVIRDLPTCGEAWNIGVRSAFKSGADYVLLSADDLLPRSPWYVCDAIDAWELDDALPAARCYGLDGEPQNHDGAPGDTVAFSRVPFLPAELARDVFPIPPLHYYSDVWIGDVLRANGRTFKIAADFKFTHLWAQARRRPSDEHDRQLYDAEKTRILG